ncbi:MAG: hypothetical protein GYA35_02505 [Thermoanaerobaculaceae bacterium]|nr:hypothetical protein [Thermoanaerobaculaceae bacterium]
MNGYFNEFEKWDKREPLLVRVDYGYPLPKTAFNSFNALYDTIAEITTFLEEKKGENPTTIYNSHYLLSPRRKKNLFNNFIRAVEGKPILFETRFIKSFKKFCSLFSKEGIKYSKVDLLSDGALPPLYSTIRSNRELFLKNLLYEWESALLMARGRSSLIDVAKIIAKSDEPLTLTQISEKMGITLGATASYLSWMEEASLIRKEKKRFSLRHEGLYFLFNEKPLEKSYEPPKMRKEDPMDMD